MPDKMNDYLETSLEGIKKIAEMDTIVGNPINTPSGVTVIPISKVTIGFASGGVDYGSKKTVGVQNYGGGGGTGVSITPLGFLTVSPDAEVRLISVNDANTSVERITSLIEHAPELIEKIKNAIL